jgi:hypothetical protein
MKSRSIHDNRIVRYEVDAEERRIVLHTVSDGEPREKTKVVFEGVLAYHLEGDNFGNILFDVTEVDVQGITDANRDLFARGRKFGWPGPWNDSDEAAIEHLKTHSAKAWEISSAYGLNGWVLCGACNIQGA